MFAKSCALRSFWAYVYQSRGIYTTSLFRSVLFIISILYGSFNLLFFFANGHHTFPIDVAITRGAFTWHCQGVALHGGGAPPMPQLTNAGPFVIRWRARVKFQGIYLKAE
jgi:hypothetical protein